MPGQCFCSSIWLGCHLLAACSDREVRYEVKFNLKFAGTAIWLLSLPALTNLACTAGSATRIGMHSLSPRLLSLYPFLRYTRCHGQAVRELIALSEHQRRTIMQALATSQAGSRASLPSTPGGTPPRHPPGGIQVGPHLPPPFG